jgi:hypothetical protein
MSDPAIPYSAPRECTPPEFGGCGQVHIFKTHHLNIDDTGSSIIEEVLFEKVKAHLFAYGFTVAGTVKHPPAMGIGLGPMTPGQGQWGNIPIVRAEDASRG